MKWWKKTSIKK